MPLAWNVCTRSQAHGKVKVVNVKNQNIGPDVFSIQNPDSDSS